LACSASSETTTAEGAADTGHYDADSEGGSTNRDDDSDDSDEDDSDVQVVSPEEEDASRSWMDKCTFRCTPCKRSFKTRVLFRRHLLGVHDGLTEDDYRQQVGDPLHNIRLFKCRLCDNCFPCEMKWISEHMDQVHSTDLQHYRNITNLN